mmetsp:Transcript_82722/g.246746  ORF Transcript_82722/g.246746 Transcript_82722/m.246746 type:complete len:310 (-) Transcript_82722:217-1146(-)
MCTEMSQATTIAQSTATPRDSPRRPSRTGAGSRMPASLRNGMMGSRSSTRGDRRSLYVRRKPMRTSSTPSSHMGQAFSGGKQRKSVMLDATSTARQTPSSVRLGAATIPTHLGGCRPHAAREAPQLAATAMKAARSNRLELPGTFASVSKTHSCGPSVAASSAAHNKAASAGPLSPRESAERRAMARSTSAWMAATKMRHNSEVTISPGIKGRAHARNNRQRKSPMPLDMWAMDSQSLNWRDRTTLKNLGVYASYLLTGSPSMSSLTMRVKARAQLAIHQTTVERTVRVSIHHTQSGSCSSYWWWPMCR